MAGWGTFSSPEIFLFFPLRGIFGLSTQHRPEVNPIFSVPTQKEKQLELPTTSDDSTRNSESLVHAPI